MLLSTYSATIAIVDELEPTNELRRPLCEYQVEANPAENLMRCCIASEAGKRFEIIVENKSLFHTVVISIYLDGVHAVWGMLEKGQMYNVQSVRTSTNSWRSLQFAQLNVTDDENSFVANRRQLEKLGSIEIDFYRVLTQGKSQVQYRPEDDMSSLTNDSVHETSKKAGAHCAGLGKESRGTIEDDAMNVVSYMDIGEDQMPRPIAALTFKYRPEAILRAEGVICPGESIFVPTDEPLPQAPLDLAYPASPNHTGIFEPAIIPNVKLLGEQTSSPPSLRTPFQPCEEVKPTLNINGTDEGQRKRKSRHPSPKSSSSGSSPTSSGTETDQELMEEILKVMAKIKRHRRKKKTPKNKEKRRPKDDKKPTTIPGGSAANPIVVI
ncbi:hypothetical protein C8Q75DRAFT_808617 [Abortiporus biennis]|nr:hypothetical protein C8Q75DRAFT_808617 [Abortiporus biennis]